MRQEIKKNMDLRLATVEGHIRAIRNMISDGKPCEEILLQISATESALKKVGNIILKNHLEHCVREGVKDGNLEMLDEFSKVLDKFL